MLRNQFRKQTKSTAKHLHLNYRALGHFLNKVYFPPSHTILAELHLLLAALHEMLAALHVMLAAPCIMLAAQVQTSTNFLYVNPITFLVITFLICLSFLYILSSIQLHQKLLDGQISFQLPTLTNITLMVANTKTSKKNLSFEPFPSLGLVISLSFGAGHNFLMQNQLNAVFVEFSTGR